MKKSYLEIYNFFTEPVAIETLGFFRIAVAGFALIQLLILLPDWMSFYGPHGLLPWIISDTLSTKHTPGLSDIAALASPVLSSNGTIYLITTIYFLSLAGLIAGYKTRLMGALAWLMHLILNTTGHFTAYGVETFTHIALFYCMVLPVGCCLSLDARKRNYVIPSACLITLSVRVIQLHLCIMYLSCGIEKAMGYQWWNGEAIWIALQQDQFHEINVNWMPHFPIIPKLLCWGTLMVETLYPIGIFCSKTKKLWLAGIVAMHLSIAFFLGLHLFGSIMILLNIAAFGKHVYPNLLNYTKTKRSDNMTAFVLSQ